MCMHFLNWSNSLVQLWLCHTAHCTEYLHTCMWVSNLQKRWDKRRWLGSLAMCYAHGGCLAYIGTKWPWLAVSGPFLTLAAWIGLEKSAKALTHKSVPTTYFWFNSLYSFFFHFLVTSKFIQFAQRYNETVMEETLELKVTHRVTMILLGKSKQESSTGQIEIRKYVKRENM